jgi:hypothetical protein
LELHRKLRRGSIPRSLHGENADRAGVLLRNGTASGCVQAIKPVTEHQQKVIPKRL